MSARLTIDDPAFDRAVTLRDAYRVMERFVAAHVQRGEVPTGELLAYLGIAPDGGGGDPAALTDYLDVVTEVVGAGSDRADPPAGS
jgi:hypothetical protein